MQEAHQHPNLKGMDQRMQSMYERCHLQNYRLHQRKLIDTRTAYRRMSTYHYERYMIQLRALLVIEHSVWSVSLGWHLSIFWNLQLVIFSNPIGSKYLLTWTLQTYITVSPIT